MSEPLVLALPSLAVLVITGDDRKTWLQGQISNDVHRGGTIHAFRLDSTGKIEAELRAVEVESRILVITDASRADALTTSLDRRIVMEDATITNEKKYAVIGAYSDDALSPALLPFPSVSSRRGGRDGIEWMVPSAELDARAAELAASLGTKLSNEDDLERERIARGMPRLGVDFDACLPQETGLVASTVSFTKGCYVGQEPVVMLEHRGKPPRRMMAITGPKELEAPFELARADGTVVGRCASYADGNGIALIKRADATPGGELFNSRLKLELGELVAIPTPSY